MPVPSAVAAASGSSASAFASPAVYSAFSPPVVAACPSALVPAAAAAAIAVLPPVLPASHAAGTSAITAQLRKRRGGPHAALVLALCALRFGLPGLRLRPLL